MRKIIGLVALIALLGSCSSGVPTPVSKVEKPKDYEVVNDSIAVKVDTVVVPTITLTEEKGLDIVLKITDSLTTVTAPDLSLDSTMPISEVLVQVNKDGTLKYLRINNHIVVGEKIETGPPCKLLDDGRVKVLKGATLQFLSRYYGVSVKRLVRCNNIDDANYITAGTILRLNCPCDACND